VYLELSPGTLFSSIICVHWELRMGTPFSSKVSFWCLYLSFYV